MLMQINVLDSHNQCPFAQGCEALVKMKWLRLHFGSSCALSWASAEGGQDGHLPTPGNWAKKEKILENVKSAV